MTATRSRIAQHSLVSLLNSQLFDTKKIMFIHSCSLAVDMDTGLGYSSSLG